MQFQLHMRRWHVAVLAALLAMLVAGGVAYATIPDSNNVYTACVHKSTGAVRLIDRSQADSSPTSRCTSAETQVTWNQVGPQGPQGLQGEKGDKGDK
jgi:hypothetical protein